jgi:hypothetical protein
MRERRSCKPLDFLTGKVLPHKLVPLTLPMFYNGQRIDMSTGETRSEEGSTD